MGEQQPADAVMFPFSHSSTPARFSCEKNCKGFGINSMLPLPAALWPSTCGSMSHGQNVQPSVPEVRIFSVCVCVYL